MTKVLSGPELSVATAGEAVELHCTAETSNPAPGFKWLRNGVEVRRRHTNTVVALCCRDVQPSARLQVVAERGGGKETTYTNTVVALCCRDVQPGVGLQVVAELGGGKETTNIVLTYMCMSDIVRTYMRLEKGTLFAVQYWYNRL